LALVAVWLWAWTAFAYTNDLPRQMFMHQRLGFTTGPALLLLADAYRPALALALVVAIASCWVRRLRVLGGAGLIIVPAILLMGLYLQMGLSVRQVQVMSDEKQALVNQRAARAEPVAAPDPTN
jgi:hypothetical protein